MLGLTPDLVYSICVNYIVTNMCHQSWRLGVPRRSNIPRACCTPCVDTFPSAPISPVSFLVASKVMFLTIPDNLQIVGQSMDDFQRASTRRQSFFLGESV